MFNLSNETMLLIAAIGLVLWYAVPFLWRLKDWFLDSFEKGFWR